MTKAEIITAITEKTGIEKAIVATTLESFFSEVKNTLSNGDALYVRGFGSFINKKRAAKKARNIIKKQTIMVAEHFVPSFKPAKEFMEQVKHNVKS